MISVQFPDNAKPMSRRMRSRCQYYSAKPMSKRMRSRCQDECKADVYIMRSLCQGECEADVKTNTKPMSRRPRSRWQEGIHKWKHAVRYALLVFALISGCGPADQRPSTFHRNPIEQQYSFQIMRSLCQEEHEADVSTILRSRYQNEC